MAGGNRITEMATEMPAIPRFFFQTIIFPADFGLICGDVGLEGLWIVRDRRSRVFFCSNNSRSLSTKFVGDVIGVVEEERFGLYEVGFVGVEGGEDIART